MSKWGRRDLTFDMKVYVEGEGYGKVVGHEDDHVVVQLESGPEARVVRVGYHRITARVVCVEEYA